MGFCPVSGHDFSRAVKAQKGVGLQPLRSFPLRFLANFAVAGAKTPTILAAERHD
jgi:hypothetical protein